MKNTESKVLYLDGIRGVAAFLVFVHHFMLIFFNAYFTFDYKSSHLDGWDIKYGQSVLSVVTNGNFFVFIFFILSGFVISRRYFNEGKIEILVSAAQRRFLRLYIPISATLILSYCLLKAGMYHNVSVSKTVGCEWWFGKMWVISNPLKKLLHSLFIGTMFQYEDVFDTTLWSMTPEVACSFFVFSFLALTHQIRNRFISLLLMLAYTKFTENMFLLSFMLGVSLNYFEGFLATNQTSKATRFFWVFVLLTVSLILGSYPSLENINLNGTIYEKLPATFVKYNSYFHPIGAFLLVLAFVISKRLQTLISGNVFRFLGRVSFSLYLLHPLVLGSFTCYLFLLMNDHINYIELVVIIFILSTLMCLFCSWLMTRYIDEKGTDITKRLYKYWRDIPLTEKLFKKQVDYISE